jgi:hypothetical protein
MFYLRHEFNKLFTLVTLLENKTVEKSGTAEGK